MVHEGQLRRLESLEARLVGDLQRTLQKKNVAFDKLNAKSPSLQKSVQPRLAYRYKRNAELGNTMSERMPGQSVNEVFSGINANSTQSLRNEEMRQSSTLSKAQEPPATTIENENE